MLRPAVESDRTIDLEAELAGNFDLIADRLKRFADQLLARVRSIDLRRIEERHALFKGRADGLDALGLVRGRAVIGADAHASGAEFRDLQSSEFSYLHGG